MHRLGLLCLCTLWISTAPLPADAQVRAPNPLPQTNDAANYTAATTNYQRMLKEIDSLHADVKSTAGSASFDTAKWQRLVAYMREVNGLHRSATKGEDLLGEDFNFEDAAAREAFIAQLREIIRQRQANAAKGDYSPVLSGSGNVYIPPILDPSQPEQPSTKDEKATTEFHQSAEDLALQKKREAYAASRAVTMKYRHYHRRAAELHQKEEELRNGRGVLPRDATTRRYEQLLNEATEWHQRVIQSAGGTGMSTAWEPMVAKFKELDIYHQAHSMTPLLPENFNFNDVARREKFLTAIRGVITHRDKMREAKNSDKDRDRELARLKRRLELAMQDIDGLYRRQTNQNPYIHTIDYAAPGQRVQFLNTISAYIDERQKQDEQMRAELGDKANERLRFRGGKHISPFTGDPI